MIELADLLQATGGSTHGSVFAGQFSDFCDSRQVAPGQLFVAVRTDWADGHDDIREACQGGASGVLCERPVDLAGLPVTCIVVADTQAALADWARFVLRKQGVQVTGITGSMGKTTAKEATALVLEAVQPTFKNPGSLSLPVALGALRPEQRLAVLEMACDSPGEMAELVRLAAPRCGVVLNISEARLETLGSVEDVAREKAQLVESLPVDGWAVLNSDDPLVAAMAQQAAAQVLTIGLGPRAAVRASEVQPGPTGLTFRLTAHGQSELVSCGLLGKHNVYPLLAAAALGLIYGLELAEIAARLRALQPLPGRLRPLLGKGDVLVLDDCYSSTPAALNAALDTLAGLPHRPRVAVLGDMTRLGAHEEASHLSAGRRAAAAVDLLVTVGERMHLTATEAARHGLPAERIRVTYTPEDAARVVAAWLQPGAAVLVKGSAEMRLEETVRRLLPEPERAGELLVHQGPEWRGVRRNRPPRPTWVEIDLEAIAHNVRRLCALIGSDVALMVIVKADGYGHGAIKTARTALNNGASWLGVACLSEALALRRVGIEAPILALGYTPPWQAREMVEQQIDATVFSLENAQALSRAALELGRTACVHVKVDTGMGRLGLAPAEALPFVAALQRLPGIAVRGIFTHFATADSADRQYCNCQLQQFRQALEELERAGLRPPLAHAANSAATISLPEARLDMVRVGIALYGLNPSAEVPCPPDLYPALAFKTQVAQVKACPAGSCISYGCTYRTPYDARIAVIPVGYADGFRRAPQHWGEVLVRGRRAPVVGRVCMDQTMIDVTNIPAVRQGDEVVLIGAQGHERITVDEVAARLGTINYEVVSEILARVPRVS